MSSSDEEWKRSRSDSGESLLGLPMALQRQPSTEDKERDSLDLSFLDMDTVSLQASLAPALGSWASINSLNVSGNRMDWLPSSLNCFLNLQVLDLSQNQLTKLDTSITSLTKLTTLIATNNRLDEDSFPKQFAATLSSSLKVLSLGGNQFKTIPAEILELNQLRSLYLGGNQIEEVTRDIKKLENLRVLYLGGNLLEAIPGEVGLLQNLQALSLCENRLHSLPSSIAMLRNLRSLALHRNMLTTLPTEIVKLRGLIELSLRNNPLVVRFVRDMMYNPPTLLELAGRCVKVNKINFADLDLPYHLVDYLTTAHRCVNPKCKGVYFDTRVEHVKFVDFCGIYRLPLLQYLCSPRCTTTSTPDFTQTSSEDESELQVPLNKLQRVLLG